ncbi:MAG: ATP-binding protein [Bryobacteraceae bacterium]
MPTRIASELAAHRLRALSELPLVGRDREMIKLLNLAATKSPALIYGPSGLGKTRLLLEVARKLSAEGASVAYIRFQQPLHAFLLTLAGQLGLDCAGTSSIALRGALWQAFELRPRVILLDDIAEATPPFYRFLERVVATRGNTIIGAANPAYATGALRRMFWNQQSTVALQNLGRRDASALIESSILAFLSGVSVSADFAPRVARAARGNPGRIVEMCIRAADPAYRAESDHIRFGALVMDSLTGLIQ